MNYILRVCSKSSVLDAARSFSVSSISNAEHSCKVLIVGGGTGGCVMAARLTRKLKQKQSVIVLEPSSDHYYQPLWTLIGAGVYSVDVTRRSEKSVLPKKAKWIQDYAEKVNPKECYVTTRKGDKINYEYLIIAVGLNNDYEKIKNLKESLAERNSGVSTIFSPHYCEKTFSDLQRLAGGNAIFTYPDSAIKCPGAPQKIAYLCDAYLDQTSNRHKVNMMYNTSLPVLFGVKKYAVELEKVAKRKRIHINYRHVLKEVHPDTKEAVFYDCKKETSVRIPYGMLHVSPPMKVPLFLSNARDLTDQCGQLTVDKYTLQHTQYNNIFGIGDCTNTPNSKTAAAIAKQSVVVTSNLLHLIRSSGSAGSAGSVGTTGTTSRYDGYGACPLVTEYGKCIMAEFLYDGQVHETMPWDQAKESTIAYYMKKDLFPFMYWNIMLKGWYSGPEAIRRIINPFNLMKLKKHLVVPNKV